MAYNKQQILNIFDDNIMGDITPRDMRVFIEAIYDSKQDQQAIITDPKFYDYESLRKGNVIIIAEPDNKTGNNGIFIVQKDRPRFKKDFELVTGNKMFIDILTSGLDNQILSSENGMPKWIQQEPGFHLLGSDTVENILRKKAQKGDIWIVTKDQDQVHPHAKAGDGMVFNKGWQNIGQLRGSKGEASSIPGPQGIQGPAGTTGAKGDAGLNGLSGATGPQGPKGDKGPKGDGYHIKGSCTFLELQTKPRIEGDIWIIAGNTNENGLGYQYNGILWESIGKLIGETGATGAKGVKGDSGAKGDTGSQGNQGVQGSKGDTGSDGKKGDKGDPGHDGPVGPAGKSADLSHLLYTNPKPTPHSIGGIEAGETFHAIPINSMFDKLLYPYQLPAFTSFKIDGVPTKVEVGDTVAVGLHTLSFAYSHAENVHPDIELFSGGSKIGAVVKPATSLHLDLGAGITQSTKSTYRWEVKAHNTRPTPQEFKKSFTVTWELMSYFGSAVSDDITPSNVLLLQKQMIGSRGHTYLTPKTQGPEYKYIVYPKVFGKATSIKDADSGFAVAMSPTHNPKTIQVTNKFNVTTDYYVYRSQNETDAKINILIK